MVSVLVTGDIWHSVQWVFTEVLTFGDFGSCIHAWCAKTVHVGLQTLVSLDVVFVCVCVCVGVCECVSV